MYRKFLILGDLHGRKPKIHFKDFDAIITPGDFCSEERIRDFYAITYKEFLENPYNYREWWEISGKRNARKLIEKSLKSGRKILEYLNSFNLPVYIIPGNWDWTKNKNEKWDFLRQDFFEKYLVDGLYNLINCDEKIVDLDEYHIIGYGKCNGPELFKYRDYEKIFKEKDIERNKKDYQKLLTKYDRLFKKATNKKKPIIFLSHNVPFNTPLDKITNKNSPRYGYHYGSLIAREMIEKYQPLVCIGGHMHENFGKCKIGKTTCINAGFGSDANSLLEIEGNKIERLEFYKK